MWFIFLFTRHIYYNMTIPKGHHANFTIIPPFVPHLVRDDRRPYILFGYIRWGNRGESTMTMWVNE
jgi:hypothetical protein